MPLSDESEACIILYDSTMRAIVPSSSLPGSEAVE